ncbi:kinase-like protein [Macrolepiota fuliginosa MF-IS2]|uniref:Kinase-like protein n=1 Tax=Macrolepiota fuliginosa MF-IS2 TaxID=1400762 RepID=A0A9P5X331_9AGAR|nr:kinase-like protein [Macrolepiota fuliginosa MF-IS2]
MSHPLVSFTTYPRADRPFFSPFPFHPDPYYVPSIYNGNSFPRTQVPFHLSRSQDEPLKVRVEITNEVHRLVRSILDVKQVYKAFLDSKGEKAQMALDTMQKMLDNEDTPEDLRLPVLHAIVQLCRASGTYPQCLVLRGTRSDEHQPVASGRFGEIWRGYFEDRPVALKVARLIHKTRIDHFTKKFSGEATLWKSFIHPNLHPFYGIYWLEVPDHRVCLVSPWAENGNVAEYLKANPDIPRFPLVFDILAGLGYLHQRKVIHGNLKSANVLVSPGGSACLTDFGLSSIVDTDIIRWTSLETVTQTSGTVRWEAPELIDELDDGSAPKPTLLSDVYSLASVIYEVLTGRLPFHEFPHEATILSKVIKGITPTKPSAMDSPSMEITDEIWGVMKSCWSFDLSERPTVKQVYEALHQLPQPSLTEERIAQNHTEHKHSYTTPLAPQDFRTAIRGHANIGFSEEEVKLLQGYNVRDGT